MNRTKIFLALTLLLSVAIMLLGSCKPNNIIEYPDAVILKELPKVAVGSNREAMVIRSEQELMAVYTEEYISRISDLQNIDFSRYTLLLGYCFYANEVSYMKHLFSKTGVSSYTYLLQIAGDATIPDAFRYGILVAKLPITAEITFEIDEINEIKN